MELQLPRGMRDFPPEEKILRDEVIATLKKIFELYGFNPLETPIVERWEILSAKYAGGTELLKETFKLKDQGGRELGLRYELTVSLARFIGLNPTIKRPFKRYQIGTVYRDGPIKKGRYREFYQCDVDTVGTSSMLADAECLNLTCDLFRLLGFDYEIQINNRKLLQDVLAQSEISIKTAGDVLTAIDKLAKIGPAEVRRELEEKGLSEESLSKLLTLLEVRGDNRQRLSQMEARLSKSEGLEELRQVFEYLDEPERVLFLPSLARGQAYYTGTIFEVYAKDSEITGSFAAGGRWDEMIGNFLETSERYPAVGISFGLEPIIEEMKARREKSTQSLPKTVTQVYVVPFKNLLVEGRRICQELRRAGIKTDMELSGRGISDGLKYANAYGIPFVVIVGPDEVAQGKVKLRDMRSGEEKLLTSEETVHQIAKRSSL
ncbi:histidine--tRNA ligase [Candidatus Acetothermia bacterium]|jgi:histidyl-tRNA synthetase|nr:histidine--tRNA ligase [Candidatus Acetothermia bacterium]MCI2431802.1 histidine--tRNA ligase [Candidatus Acetothermia bacterium]MCI2437200.1 histidine--tRNA ligase [Candidatus Acetothermia bacterium]